MEYKSCSIGKFKYHYAINHVDRQASNPIIFINGAFQSMKSWKYVADYLSEYTTTILADLPGWGRADYLPSEYDFNFLADAVMQILQKENIDKVTVVSTSYGTPVAIHFVRKYREKVTDIVLSSTLLEIAPSMMDKYPLMEKLILNKNRIALTAFLLDVGLINTHKGEAGLITNYSQIKEMFSRQINKINQDQLNKFLANTKRIMNEGKCDVSAIKDVRMLACTGEYDSFTPPSQCSAISKQFDNGSYVSIKSADHLFLLEQGLVTCNLLKAFIKDQSLKTVHGCMLENKSMSRNKSAVF